MSFNYNKEGNAAYVHSGLPSAMKVTTILILYLKALLLFTVELCGICQTNRTVTWPRACQFIRKCLWFLRSSSLFRDSWAEVNDPVANDGANNRNIDYQGRHRHHYSLNRCKPQNESAGISICAAYFKSFTATFLVFMATEVPWVNHWTTKSLLKNFGIGNISPNYLFA